VDDEELARMLVREFLGAHPEVTVVGECANGFEAVKAVAELSPDILFLDVQMPKLDGFEVLEVIEPPPAVVFVTAYDQYALRAFEVHAVDYLLKPFSKERFDAALERAETRARSSAPAEAPGVRPTAMAAAARAERLLSRVAVKDGTRVTVIPVEKIDFVKSDDDYVLVRSQGKEHIKQQTLTSLEAQLDPARFVRIHRSYLLNMEMLARLETTVTGAPVAVLSDGTRLPVSRTGAARLRVLLS
jgi:two-component system LytT family response regulator